MATLVFYILWSPIVYKYDKAYLLELFIEHKFGNLEE